tara:strand:- start:357 stop:575 length:219 start_codon:yes stop_codon:yes gene_type:complete
MSRKKPTAMELKEAVTGIIMQQQQLTEAFRKLDFILGKFIDFSDPKDKFKAWLEKDSKRGEDEKRENKNNKK